MIWAEEYARAQAPARVNHMGENLLAPTLIAYGTLSNRSGSCPASSAATSAGARATASRTRAPTSPTSATRAQLDGDQWVVNGQKVWTSLAHVSHWCFVVARTDPASTRHKGLSFLLVPMDQPGVEVRPIEQSPAAASSTRCSSTTPARTRDLTVGDVDDGWRVAMGLLGFERGVSTLAQQVGFERELDARDRAWRGRTTARRPGRPRASGRRVDRPAPHEVERDAQHGRQGRARSRGVDLEAVLGLVAPRPRQPDDRRARCRTV